MYLYNKVNNKLEIYKFIPQEKELYKYRLEQMKQIPRDRTFFRAKTKNGIEGYEVFRLYEDRFDTVNIPIEILTSRLHSLNPVPTYDDRYTTEGRLLHKYYSGYLKNKKITKIQGLKHLRYFLLNQTEYTNYVNKMILEGIIEIPESLYLLSLIEQEKFSLIKDKDITEQLNLFKLEQLKDVDLETIESIDYIGLAPNCYAKTIKKAENDAHILKLIKK